MHCILVFVIFQFEFYLFQLVDFHFNRLIVSALCFCSLFSISVGCIPFQYKSNDINACYLYAFVLFDESKGGEKLENWKPLLIIKLN